MFLKCAKMIPDKPGLRGFLWQWQNPPANAGDPRVAGLIPGLRRSPAVGSGCPLQYPCLENPTGRGAWQATVHGVTKSQICQSD